MTLQQLIRYGSISEEIADWLIMFVRADTTYFISGGTGSGKTTFPECVIRVYSEKGSG